MHDFHYQDKELYCEEVPVQRIVRDVGTPCYIYSYRTLRDLCPCDVCSDARRVEGNHEG